MKHGPCSNCGSPLVKVPFKRQSRKDHPWGLTTWGSELVCSKAHGSLSGALECHYARPDMRETFERLLREPSWFLPKEKSEDWQGGYFAVPWAGTRDITIHNFNAGKPCPKKPKQQKRENRLKRALRALRKRRAKSAQL